MLLGSGDARVELNVGLGTFPRIWNIFRCKYAMYSGPPPIANLILLRIPTPITI
jgi:hypothetical protein